MFNLIYVLLGVYAIKIILIRLTMKDSKRKNIQKKKSSISLKIIYRKFKNIFNEKNNIFIFNHNKIEEDNSALKNQKEWQVKRHMAMEKARYKCQECGNITNLDVYNKDTDDSSDELVVLCKRCYEKEIGEVHLHYEQN